MAKRDRVCGRKAKHLTRDAALIEAKRVVRAGMNVYRCPSCRFWHIGKSRSPTRAADRIGALLAKHERKMERAQVIHVNQEDWDTLVTTLENPPPANTALKRLLR